MLKIITLFLFSGSLLQAQFSSLETTERRSVRPDTETNALVISIDGLIADEGRPAGAGFSALQTMTYSDGKTTMLRPKARVYRDSEGRRRTEILNEEHQPLFEIIDPVAGFSYLFEPTTPVAHRQRLDRTLALAVPMRPWTRAKVGQRLTTIVRGRRGPDMEFLGQQMTNGIMAEGVKQTITYPKGWQGFDRAITVSPVEWFSVDLQEPVRLINENQDGSTLTINLTEIKIGEQKPEIFQPPPSYEVVDEPESFRMLLPALIPRRNTVSENMVPPPPPITGLPFSGVEKTTKVRVFPNGARKTEESTNKIWRDSKGRVRIERIRPPTSSSLGELSNTIIEITDPVAGFIYTLDERTIQHTRKPLDSIRRPESTETPLGQKSIDGFLANGSKRRTGAVTEEAWTSVELKVDLLTASTGPEGETTAELKIQSRTEPDPRVFVVPRGYLLTN